MTVKVDEGTVVYIDKFLVQLICLQLYLDLNNSANSNVVNCPAISGASEGLNIISGPDGKLFFYH